MGLPALPRKFSTNSRTPITIPNRLPFLLSSLRRPQQQQQQHLSPSPSLTSLALFTPFSQQLQQQSSPHETHLISKLDACTTLSQIKQVHFHILCGGLGQSCFVLTKLVRTLTRVGIPVDSYSRSVFDRVTDPNPFLYTALIRGYLMEGLVGEAVRFYGLMRKEGARPLSFTFTGFFKACGSVGDVDLGRQMHAQTILVGGFDSDLPVGNALTDMYAKCGCLECGHKVFDEMPERNLISWIALIVAYTKMGDIQSARELFDRLPVKDMVAWTTMVTGFAQNARPGEAIEYFQRMQDAGVRIDEVTLTGVISACAQLGVPKYADWIRDVAEKSGYGANGDSVVLGSALIDMYSKCGSIEEAFKIFEGMKERNVFSYSSMILGFAMHGCAHAALDLFHNLVKTDIKPNNVTFVGVLTACSHVGMVKEGWHIFESMEKCYGVTPSADHYACMVDLLGRSGRMKEALELVETMPIKPNAGVWGALLGACCIHGNPDVAEIAASHLFELEPDCIGNYLLLCKTYALAGRWTDVLRVRKMMKTKSLKKRPGISWVEGEKGMIHKFVAGDMAHPKSKEINQAIEDLLHRLEAKGYQPNLSSVPYDVSNEQKRQILMTHSDKLALGFGLISTNPGCTIKIFKNLRICEDCHLVFCGASLITGREIVVRDKIRFHHFRDGTCSCGNFW